MNASNVLFHLLIHLGMWTRIQDCQFELGTVILTLQFCSFMA